MTLHALRLKIGDATFFKLLKEWIDKKEGGNATIPEFIALAQKLSRPEPQAFFNEWLFTGGQAGEPGGAGGGEQVEGGGVGGAQLGSGPTRERAVRPRRGYSRR